LAVPELADGATDYFYVAGEDLQGTVTFSGLSSSLSYKVEVVASRSSAGSVPKTGTYTVNGLPADSDSKADDDNGIDFDVFVDGYTDGDVLRWNAVRPDGNAQIVFKAVSDAGSGTAGSNVYLNAMRMTEVLVYEQWLESHPGLTGDDREGTADPDGDGVDNETEMVVGTDPLDPLSRHRLLLESGTTLIAPTQPGRWYSIEKTVDLTDTESWTELGRWGPGDGTTLTFPVEFTPGFYRCGIYLRGE
jgi:hypothetical protein